MTNAAGKTSLATQQIRVFNRPPTANIQASGAAGSLTLSGAGSTDPDETALSYVWRLPTGEKNSEEITVSGLPSGSHEVALTVTDAGGATNTAYYTVTVPDSQGFREPENPEGLVLGLHYQFFNLFRNEGKLFVKDFPDFYGIDGKSLVRLINRGTIDNLNLNNLSKGQNKRAILWGGYLHIPADGEYEFNIQGSTRTAFFIGNDLVVRNSSRNLTGHPKIPDETARIKLREGYHRVALAQATSILSKSATEHPSWIRLAMRRDDGFATVLGTGDFFRTPLPAEAEQLGRSKTTYGVDYLSLGGPLPDQAVPEPGNQPPQISIRSEEVAGVLASKSVRLYADVSDPDGDTVTWEWHTGEGPLHKNQNVVGHIFTSGEHLVSVIARDEHGAQTAATTVISVPELPEYGRSISASTSNAGRARVTPIFPGETAGAIPSSSWMAISGSKEVSCGSLMY